MPCANLRLHLARTFQRFLSNDCNDRVDTGIQAIDPIKTCAGQVHRGQTPGLDE